ncbi:alpha/beta hydrolase [Rhodococcus koreensis]
MAIDEATTGFLAQLAESGMPPIHEMEPTQARGLTAMLKDMFGAGPEVARSELIQIPAEGRTIAAHLLVPAGEIRGMIVYYHGGGWVIGAIDEFETLARQLATRTGCAVALVDYRLAPEHPYPAAVEDAWDALVWFDRTMPELLGGRVPLVAAGDSAGGNLAAIVSQRARTNGPNISQQILVYPVTDCDLSKDSYTNPENQLLLSRDTMIWFWDHYAPESMRKNPDVSPAHAADLSGLPPAVVLTAEHDVLHDEGVAYAEALAQAGVPVAHREFAGQMHGFFTMVNLLPGSENAIDFVVAEIDKHLCAVV